MDLRSNEPEWLEEEFPLGNGTADTDAGAYCPYCGEWVELSLDPGGGSEQEYVEDCEVCCRPWRVQLHYDETGAAHIQLDSLDE